MFQLIEGDDICFGWGKNEEWILEEISDLLGIMTPPNLKTDTLMHERDLFMGNHW